MRVGTPGTLVIAGIPGVVVSNGLPGMRQAGATLLPAQGGTPADRAGALGHANVSKMLKQYREVNLDMHRTAADTLDAALTTAS